MIDGWDWLAIGPVCESQLWRLWLQSLKMAAFVSRIFWLHFWIVRGSGDHVYIRSKDTTWSVSSLYPRSRFFYSEKIRHEQSQRAGDGSVLQAESPCASTPTQRPSEGGAWDQADARTPS